MTSRTQLARRWSFGMMQTSKDGTTCIGFKAVYVSSQRNKSLTSILVI